MLTRARRRSSRCTRERCRLALLDAAMALLRLGNAVMQRYGEAKARARGARFRRPDRRAASLLGTSAAVEWVLYKLDGGLDHILVDEAQDTSPVQWQVIRALAEEFFSGTGAREVTRTLFAVGDEKQSIYGFQGAAPAHVRRRRARRSPRTPARAGLRVAARSAHPVVPRGGAAAGRRSTASLPTRRARRALTAAREPIRARRASRRPRRADRGLADREAGDGRARRAVVAARRDRARPRRWCGWRRASPETIDGWLKSSEMLASEGRPIRAGDILILVRKRAPFAPVMVSALKARGIKVAGADRLMLIEQIAVQDLMALGDFICCRRTIWRWRRCSSRRCSGSTTMTCWRWRRSARARCGRSCWRAQPATSAFRCRRPRSWSGWRAQAEQVPPFEFYAGAAGWRGHARRACWQRLGAEAADAIDEFLNLALAYDDGAPPTLQGFLGWLREGSREIKRDMEQGRDEVRVMTVHGAKGLEAPIVFLPDTCSTRSGRRPGGLLRARRRGAAVGSPAPFLWPVKGTSEVAGRAAGQGGGRASRGRGAQPTALRGADARARPARTWRASRAAAAAVAGLLVQSDPGWPCRARPGGRGRRRPRRLAPRERADGQARGVHGKGAGVRPHPAAAGLGEAPGAARSR